MSRKVVTAVLAGIVVSTFLVLPAIGDDASTSSSAGAALLLKDTNDDGTLEALTTLAAVKGAGAENEPVEDLSQRTETFSTVANPDGTFTATAHASPVRVKQGDEWVKIDPTLQKQPDGSYKPQSASADVRIGGGGSKEAARISFGRGESFAVSWPQDLPTPTVNGPVATYRLSAASDLVVTATASGVATHLRLNSRPSVDDPVFSFALTTENLKVKETSGGGLKVTDVENTQVGTTSSLVAWDSRTDEAGDTAKIVPLEATLSQGKDEADSTKQILSLAAPDGYLSDPRTVYPVIIDPDINAVNELRDTYTRAGDTTPAGTLPYLMVGREGGSSNANPARVLIQWENTMLEGKTITAASMNFYQYFGGSCSERDTNIHPLTAEFHESTTVDTNRPAVDTGTGASSILTASRGPNCTDGSGFVSASVLGLAKLWAKGPSAGGIANWGVQLNVPSASGSDATFERRFCSEEPSTNTAIPCSSAARVPFMKFTYSDPAPIAPSDSDLDSSFNGTDATLSTIVTGTDGTNLRGRFLLKRGTTTIFDGFTTNYVPSGTEVEKVITNLPYGTYTLQAWASDGAQSSPASPVKTYVWDGTPAAGDAPSTTTSRISDVDDYTYVTSTAPSWRSSARVTGTAQIKYTTEVHTSTTVSSATLKASCTTALVNAGSSALCTPTTGLTDGATYWARSRATDANGLVGAWSDWLEFKVDTSPYPKGVGVIVTAGTASLDMPLVDNAGSNVRAKVTVKRGSTIVSDSLTGYVASGQTVTKDVPSLTAGTYTYTVSADNGQRLSTFPLIGTFEVADPRPNAPSECADYATTNVTGNWSCINDQVVTFDANGDEVVTDIDPSNDGDEGTGFTTMKVDDKYHAHKSTVMYWGTNDVRKGVIKFTFRIGLHNHSANVSMMAELSQKARLTWTTRIRHHKAGKKDSTVFTYPRVHGCSSPSSICKDFEGRYDDGYNELPYENKWKVFWEAYDMHLVVNGEAFPSFNAKAQSDRATCYKTVSCKFLG